jgi:hypothetical protein
MIRRAILEREGGIRPPERFRRWADRFDAPPQPPITRENCLELAYMGEVPDELSAEEEEEVNLPPMLRKVKCQLPNQIYVRSHPSGPVTLERGFAAEF